MHSIFTPRDGIFRSTTATQSSLGVQSCNIESTTSARAAQLASLEYQISSVFMLATVSPSDGEKRTAGPHGTFIHSGGVSSTASGSSSCISQSQSLPPLLTRHWQTQRWERSWRQSPCHRLLINTWLGICYHLRYLLASMCVQTRCSWVI